MQLSEDLEDCPNAWIGFIQSMDDMLSLEDDEYRTTEEQIILIEQALLYYDADCAIPEGTPVITFSDPKKYSLFLLKFSGKNET